MINYELCIQEEISKYCNEKNIKKVPKVLPSFLKEHDYQLSADCFVKNGSFDSLIDCISTNENLKIFNINVTKNTKGNNYLNFAFTKNVLVSVLNNFKQNNYTARFHTTNCKKTVLVDYSSPNLAKDMHVGHLRSTIIGDALSNLFEYIGNNVVRRNHIGDCGLPFGMIVQYVMENNINIDNSSLQEIYIDSKELAMKDDEFVKNAYHRTRILQDESDQQTNEIWKNIYKKSLIAYNEIYNLLEISPKLEIKGESFYLQFVDEVFKVLEDKNAIKKNDDGRIVISLEGLNDMTFMKSENKGCGYTYDTTDIIGLWYRIYKENVDEIYYVVDTGQTEHFKQLFAIANKIGWTDNKNIKHINFGIIQGDTGKRLKSRDGDAPKLIDLVMETIKETEKVYNEKQKKQPHHSTYNKKTIESIAIGSLKWFDLMHNRTSDYKFDFDRMLKFTAGTYAYVTYALVRCNSIFERIIGYDIAQYEPNINDFDEYDFDIMRELCNMPSIFDKVCDTNMLHFLTDHLTTISEKFHHHYEITRCIDLHDDKTTIKNINMGKVLIYKFVKYTIEECYKILGLPIVDKI